MAKKNPLDFKSKWEEDQWREDLIRRSEERQEYLANLFHLPGKNLDHPDFLIEGLLPAGYLAVLAGDPPESPSRLREGLGEGSPTTEGMKHRSLGSQRVTRLLAAPGVLRQNAFRQEVIDVSLRSWNRRLRYRSVLLRRQT